MFLFAIVIQTIDFIHDLYSQDSFLHIFMDGLTVFLSLIGLMMLISIIIDRAQEIETLHLKVEKTEIDLNLSRSKFKVISQEYNEYITEQFDNWGLTTSEREVALILLKGLSLNEIAKRRNTKEKTVRQQASTIYHKSNVSGRHELSAWFFEDFLKIASIA